MSAAPLRQPLVSVVMPVYNAQRYVGEAVASIIQQTLPDWELICIDDGSSDGSQQLLQWLAAQDVRIRVVRQVNAGFVAALNHGCSLARGPLICRMDADDIALPDRLQRQVEHMRRHPECTVVGGAILEIDAQGTPLGVQRLAAEHADIVHDLLHRRTGHFHPTTLIRSEALEAVGGYRAAYQWVEDHDLWLRLAHRGQLANLPQPVLCYRQHADSVCWQRAAQQRQLMNQLLREAYAVRGQEAPESVMLHAAPVRQAAGPGKWARRAAKGGYARSCWKHLRQLHRSDAHWTYKLRMTLEVGLRLAGRLGRNGWDRCWGSPPCHIAVPDLSAWRARAVREVSLPTDAAAARAA